MQCMYNVADLDGKPICHGYANKESFQRYVQEQMQFLGKDPECYKRIMEAVVVV